MTGVQAGILSSIRESVVLASLFPETMRHWLAGLTQFNATAVSLRALLSLSPSSTYATMAPTQPRPGPTESDVITTRRNFFGGDLAPVNVPQGGQTTGFFRNNYCGQFNAAGLIHFDASHTLILLA